jgi:superfamily II DNA or RNA helicase
MDYELYDFIPQYYSTQTFSFNKDISNLKEFTENKLSKEEELPQHPGDLMLHQKLISKFINPNTPYDGLLLLHEMGTGKTCTAVAVAEEFIRRRKSLESEEFPSTVLKNIIVLTKGKGLQNNFINEIANVCTNSQYLNGLDKYVRNRDKRIKKNVKVNYTFETLEIFAKKISKMGTKEKTLMYENSLFIVDEAHNLRLSADIHESLIYKQIYGLFQLLKVKKILLLTGTPMKDKPEEIIDLLNLIIKDKLNLEDLKNKKIFKQKVSGYISYLRAMMSDVNRTEKGELIGTLKHLKVYPVNMDTFQSKIYLQAKQKDDDERSIFNHSRQSSLMVFPDGTYGKNGFEKNLLQTNHGYRFKSPIEFEKNLHKYSAKYFDLIQKLSDDYNHGRSSFVFSEFVKGSGLVVLSLLLELNGYTRAIPSNNLTKPQKRYVIFTNESSTIAQMRQLISIFNHPKNMNGEYISVILGSRVVMEGFTFKNIQSEYILTPHWNYSETSQIIARGLRLGSHNDLIKKGIIPEVQVYHYISIPHTKKLKDSIDLHMYQISETKDFQIQKVIRILKEIAFDCVLNKARNTITNTRLDGKRDCEYEECNYKCDNKYSYLGEDERNFKLLYFRNSQNYLILRNFIIQKVISHPTTLEEIMNETNHTFYEILLVISDIINSRESLFTRPEGSYYLSNIKNTFYVSIKPGNDDPNLLDYYIHNSAIFIGKSIDELIFSNQQNFMVNTVNKIFKSKNLIELQSYMVQLPIYLQEKFLCMAITTKNKNTPNNFVRDMILNNFKLYYNIDNEKAFVWLNQESYKCTFDYENPNYWKECNQQEKIEIESMKKDKTKVKIENNPYGYIGLLNRTTNDFCLRKVDDDQSKITDKRKKNVGKRCQNWKKKELVDLVSNRLKVTPDEDFEFNEEDAETMKNNPRLQNIIDHNGTLKDYKRVAFWNTQDINYLCNKIMQKFMDQKMVLDDPNCGTSTKIR